MRSVKFIIFLNAPAVLANFLNYYNWFNPSSMMVSFVVSPVSFISYVIFFCFQVPFINQIIAIMATITLDMGNAS